MISEDSEFSRKKSHLWVTICMAIVLSSYRLISLATNQAKVFCLNYTELPVVDVISNMLFFWLLGLLWITYHHWKKAVDYNHQLESILKSISPDAITVIDRNHKITMCSRQIESMFGIPCKTLVGKTTDSLYFDRHTRGEKGKIANRLEKYGFHVSYATGKRGNGDLFPLEIITGTIDGDKGAVILMRDITRRRNTEDALRESEARFELFMRYLPGCAFIKDGDSKYIYLNKYHERIYGWDISKALGKSDSELMPADQANQIAENDKRVLNDNSAIHYVRRTENNDKPISLLTYNFPIPPGSNGSTMIGGISLDITEQEKAEEKHRKIEKQMLQAQKLESLGILGGGIAHDFNNLLMGILGHADLALAKLPKTDPARRNIEEVVVSTQRAADLANQLLAYSGEGKFVVETVNLSNMVEEMNNLLRVSISKKAKLIFNLDENIPATKCDTTQIRQVIMNLVVNASDAMEDNSGEISIRTGSIPGSDDTFDNTYLTAPMTDDKYVYVKISDTGMGMDEATRLHIFDPFFTTKFTGRGLGLAAVMGIIRSHKGSITLDSIPGKGTTFTFYLPASNLTIDEKNNSVNNPESWQSCGTVLIADDEQTVLQVAKMMLETMGFDVVTVENGLQALNVIKNDPKKFCCVLLDLTMPDLNGIETYYEMRKLNPEIPVILSSGYNKQDEIAEIQDENLPLFLKKPYRLDSIRNTFREALKDKG